MAPRLHLQLRLRALQRRVEARVPQRLRFLPRRALVLIVALVAINALVWAVVGVVLRFYPGLTGTAVLAYTLGLRHALDADHISVIDLMTRRLIAAGQRPVAVGTFFSLGHSTIVVVTCIVVAATSGALRERFDGFTRVGNIIGTSVSAAVLLLLCAGNAWVLWRLVQALRTELQEQRDRRAQQRAPVDDDGGGGGDDDDEGVEDDLLGVDNRTDAADMDADAVATHDLEAARSSHSLGPGAAVAAATASESPIGGTDAATAGPAAHMRIEGGGVMARVFHWVFVLVDRPWKMYPVGVLFGLGFDTSSEVALLGIASLQGAKGTSMWLILIFPVLFTAGMCMIDSTDGALMMTLYTSKAFSRDTIAILYYSIVLTGITVVVAAFIGIVQVLTLVSNVASPEGRFWDGVDNLGEHFSVIGGSVCGLFLVVGVGSIAVYRPWRRHMDRRQAALAVADAEADAQAQADAANATGPRPSR